MAAEIQKTVLPAGSPNNTNPSGYLSRLKKFSRRQNNNIPFYIELVDRDLKPVIISFEDPPYGTKKIQGVELAVNPNTINLNMSKLISRQQSMTSWVEEHWGEELDTISIQGSTAAFISGASSVRASTVRNTSIDANSSLLQSQRDSNREGIPVDRKDTISYKTLRRVMLLMNNLMKFDSLGVPTDRYYILMTYDFAAYIGYMESIDVTEDATMPFKFTYTITMKSEKTLYNFKV